MLSETGAIELFGIFVTVVLFLLQGWSSFKSHVHEKELASLKNQFDKEITDLKGTTRVLFDKHDTDAAALAALDKLVAGRHYERDELDAKFKELGDTFQHGFREMGSKFDRFTEAVIAHFAPNDNVTKFKTPGSRQ